MAQDPFAAAEHDTRAIVSAGWWSSAPARQRGHALAERALMLPDGTWWLFGAGARWYRRHPADGQWHLCPPPQAVATRMSARPAAGTRMPGPPPPHVLPAGPDFSWEPLAPLPFVGRAPAADLTVRIRATVESAAALPAAEYPHRWMRFSSAAPSTVAVSWGVMLWCAAAPVFDSRLDERLLGLWAPYHARPLPAVDGPRWLTPPPLGALVGPYAELLRADRMGAAVSVLRTMWAIAGTLREDIRFRARADALLAVLDSALNDPTADHGALRYGDQAVVQRWLARCPPHLAPAMRMEAAPGDHLRHCYYGLAEAIAGVAGDAAEPAYIEPRLVATAFIAADLAVVRQDVIDTVVPWLDPRTRRQIKAMLGRPGHPLRRLWPAGTTPPDVLRHAGRNGYARVLAAMYEADLAWCRIGGIPARPRGFPTPTALLARIIGTERATAAVAKRVSPPPTAMASGAAVDPPAEPSTAGAVEVETRVDSPVPRDPPAVSDGPVPDGPVPHGPVGGADAPPSTPPRTRVLTASQDGSAAETAAAIGAGEAGADQRPARPQRTQIMSETMVGEFEFLEAAPEPEQETAPPDGDAQPVIERHGVSFVSGAEDAGALLDELYDLALACADARSTAASMPEVLLVGLPHTGQRRLARLIALTLADAGLGDGSVHIADADDVRGASEQDIAAVLETDCSTVLFERLDAAILQAPDPQAMAEAVCGVRPGRPAGAMFIATCDPRAHQRLVRDHPHSTARFRVFRLPDLSPPRHRLTLLRVLAAERQVTIDDAAVELVTEDLTRLHGSAEMVNARLVEIYLDQASARHLARSGTTPGRFVLGPEDFTTVAESIEPALRPPGAVDGVLRGLDRLVGQDQVKQAVEGLVVTARMVIDRAYYGVPSGDASRHLIFLGPPGVGKGSVAELLGKAYAALGLLASGHVVACRPVHLAGHDALDTASRVSAVIGQASGGVLLIRQAHALERWPQAVPELVRHMGERRDTVVICTGRAEEMAPVLAGRPAFRDAFGTTIEFASLSDRELVRVFQRHAEQGLYTVDEELRVELLTRFRRMRMHRDFAYARTAGSLFEQTVARQQARLAGANADAATVARLTVEDLPDTMLERLLGDLHQDP